MPNPQHRQCLDCGMETPVAVTEFRDRHLGTTCDKCDADLMSQSDGSVFTRDIAHHGETLHDATVKMDAVLQQVWESYARGVRLIVGGGRIREEVLSQCRYYRDQGYIASYSLDDPNRGAILVYLR